MNSDSEHAIATHRARRAKKSNKMDDFVYEAKGAAAGQKRSSEEAGIGQGTEKEPVKSKRQKVKEHPADGERNSEESE